MEAYKQDQIEKGLYEKNDYLRYDDDTVQLFEKKNVYWILNVVVLCTKMSQNLTY